MSLEVGQDASALIFSPGEGTCSVPCVIVAVDRAVTVRTLQGDIFRVDAEYVEVRT